MKWIVVILVILNVAAYLLGLKIDPEQVQITSAGEYKVVNPEAMSVIAPTQADDAAAGLPGDGAESLQEDVLTQLKVDNRGEVLRAIEAPAALETATSSSGAGSVETDVRPPDTPTPETETLASDAAAAPAEIKPLNLAKVEPAPPAEPVKSVKDALACYRLGPFSNQNSLASVRRKLDSEKIQHRVDEAGGNRSIKAVRVYLAVDSSDAAIEAARTRLKGMNVEHYVIRQNGIPMVQLGYFSEPGRATAYQKKLLARGLDVQTETIYHEASISSWIEVQLASSQVIDGLGLPRGMVKKQPSCP